MTKWGRLDVEMTKLERIKAKRGKKLLGRGRVPQRWGGTHQRAHVT